MTTNFDYEIELAMINLNVKGKKISPVITKEDYENYSNLFDLFNSEIITL